MAKKSVCFISIWLLLALGCAGPEKGAPPAELKAFPEARYLTAEGSGETQIEARQQALAELSRIFESRVRAETTTFARSAIGPYQDEVFEKNVESKIAVVSDVQLSGASIGRVWQDPAPGRTYHALATLDRSRAGRTWADALETVATRTMAEAGNLEHTRGRFQRMLVLNRIVVGVLRAQALESRLRVLNYPARADLDIDFGAITAELGRLRSQLRFFVHLTGDAGRVVASRISEALTASGLLMVTDPDSADAVITGQLTTAPLALNNPNAHFVRAAVTLRILETDSGAVIAALDEDVRKGHADPAEASRKAVSTLADTLAERLVADIGFGGGDATD